jgi:hypothetical protein
MSTTLATVLRAGQGAPDAVHTIQLARANRERQANFKAHVQPVPPMERDRSKSPNRGARSPTRPTAAAPATAGAAPSTPGSKKVSAPNSPLVSSSAATVADARAVVKQAKLRAAASDAAADIAAADLAATMATNNNTPPQPEEKEQS